MERTNDAKGSVARGGARRRRPLLLTLTALGATTGLLGFAGVLAVGSDQATTGVNDVNTPELAGEEGLDIVLASATYDLGTGTFTCGTDYADDLESGVVTSGGLDLSVQYPVLENYDEGYLCLRNDSDVPVDIAASTFDVVDLERACSPGEADVDESCGDGAGELSDHLQTQFYTASDGEEGACYDVPVVPGTIADLEDGEVTADLGTVDPGEVLGICPGVAWDSDPVSQTDEVQWRYAFEAVESDGEDPEEPEDPGYTNCPTDTDEENDTIASPTPGVNLSPGAAIFGWICGSDPTDHWSSTSDLAGQTTITLTWSDPAIDLDLVVYDRSGAVLDRSVLDVGTTTESVTVTATSVGTIAVVHYSGGATQYLLDVSEAFAP